MAKTLQNVIDYANGIKPNAFPAEVLTEWINECEGSVQTEILCIALGDVVTYEYEKNKDTELIVKPPHDRIYGLYLSAMIDFAHGEYSKYENTMQVYNSAMSEFAKWFIRTHTKSKVVVSGYYMNAYDLAVRHGFEGTEEDWLASLVGPQGIQGPQGERGLTGLPGKIQTVTSGENGSILVDGESVKVYDSTNDVHISNIAGLAGNNTGDIRELQQGVKNLENKIDYTRAYVDEVGEGKVDKVTGKGLSTNDFTDEDKTKLGSLKNYDDSVLQQAIENINGEKEDKANKVTSISHAAAKDTAYPSEKAVTEYVDFYCRLKGFESYFNKASYIWEGVSDDHYPSSKAVYNYVEKRISPTVQTALTDPITVNTVYDLGVQTELVITLPSGQVGDFIQVDFISGSTATDLSVNPPTTLTVNSSSGLVGFDLSPGTNTIYTLYFDWGVTGYDGTEVTYGWRFNYSEYSVDVV